MQRLVERGRANGEVATRVKASYVPLAQNADGPGQATAAVTCGVPTVARPGRRPSLPAAKA